MDILIKILFMLEFAALGLIAVFGTWTLIYLVADDYIDRITFWYSERKRKIRVAKLWKKQGRTE